MPRTTRRRTFWPDHVPMPEPIPTTTIHLATQEENEPRRETTFGNPLGFNITGITNVLLNDLYPPTRSIPIIEELKKNDPVIYNKKVYLFSSRSARGTVTLFDLTTKKYIRAKKYSIIKRYETKTHLPEWF